LEKDEANRKRTQKRRNIKAKKEEEESVRGSCMRRSKRMQKKRKAKG
jgi:hypothetical protein